MARFCSRRPKLDRGHVLSGGGLRELSRRGGTSLPLACASVAARLSRLAADRMTPKSGTTICSPRLRLKTNTGAPPCGNPGTEPGTSYFACVGHFSAEQCWDREAYPLPWISLATQPLCRYGAEGKEERPTPFIAATCRRAVGPQLPVPGDVLVARWCAVAHAGQVSPACLSLEALFLRELWQGRARSRSDGAIRFRSTSWTCVPAGKQKNPTQRWVGSCGGALPDTEVSFFKDSYRRTVPGRMSETQMGADRHAHGIRFARPTTD